jgi:hypothetical protein
MRLFTPFRHQGLTLLAGQQMRVRRPHPNPPISRLASPTAAETPFNDDQVWLNTKSGKYCKPGSRYYTKTKQGEYLSEKEAVQKGYLPANGTGE